MKLQQVCVLGGTGFVGSHLVHRLASDGRRIKVPSRHPQRHRSIAITPGVELVRANIHDREQLCRQIEGQDCVINLVGILNERGGDDMGFEQVHVALAHMIGQACQQTGVRRLLHMSALNADATRGTSRYLRSKGAGEDHVHAAATSQLPVTSFRPSVIFGPGDSFLNRFAELMRAVPYVFPLACPDSRFAPVYVADVACAFERAIEDKATFGKRYDLCGPDVFTLQELVHYTASTAALRRRILPLSDAFSRRLARLLSHLPGTPLTYDNYLSWQRDSVCQTNGLQQLGVYPTPLRSVAPMYLGDRRASARYQQYRRMARHR